MKVHGVSHRKDDKSTILQVKKKKNKAYFNKKKRRVTRIGIF